MNNKTKQALEQPSQQESVAGVVLRDGQPTLLQDKHIKETDERLFRAAPPAQQEPVAWADECRIELVNAIHFLASDFENALGAFGGDTEARRKAEGDIAHARSIASRWNWNGTSPPAQRKPLTDEEIKLQWSIFWEAECHPWAIEFARAIEHAHGIY